MLYQGTAQNCTVSFLFFIIYNLACLGQTRFLQQSSIFQSNGQPDRTIGAKNNRPTFRVPKQPQNTLLPLESQLSSAIVQSHPEDEEIVVEEYDD